MPRQVSTTLRTTTALATVADCSAIEQLRRVYSNQLGWLPTAALHQAVSERRVLCTTHRGELLAYALWRYPRTAECPTATLVHLATAKDHRHRGHAQNLLSHLCTLLASTSTAILQAWCRHDLAAHAFFAAAGFTPTLAAINPTARRHPRTLWRLPLTPTSTAALYAPPPLYGQRRQSNADTTTPPASRHRNRPLAPRPRHRQPPPAAVPNQ